MPLLRPQLLSSISFYFALLPQELQLQIAFGHLRATLRTVPYRQMKKDRERYFLQEFLKLMPELRVLNLRDSEAPDFLCDVAGIPTAIEVTRFFFPVSEGLPPQAAEAYHSRLGAELTEEHLKSTIPPVHVSVCLYRDEAL